MSGDSFVWPPAAGSSGGTSAAITTTESTRTGTIYPNGQIVYSTDSGTAPLQGAWFIGDGYTVGGVASPLAFTNPQLQGSIVKSRHKKWMALFSESIASGTTKPTLVALGHSLVYGQGPAAPQTYSWPAQLAPLLTTDAGSAVTVTNYGIGGSKMQGMPVWVADLMNFVSATAQYPTQSNLFSATGPAIAFIHCTRNDINGTPVATVRLALQTAAAMCARRGIDLVICSDPPTFNNTTGHTVDGSDIPYVTALDEIAGAYGATFVDFFTYFRTIDKLGVNLSSWYQSDNTHLTERGYQELANLVHQALLSGSSTNSSNQMSAPISAPYALSSYTTGGTAGGAVAATTVTTLEGYTSRKIVAAEGATNACVLAAGQLQFWQMPVDAVAVVINYVSVNGGATQTLDLGTFINAGGGVSSLGTVSIIGTAGYQREITALFALPILNQTNASSVENVPQLLQTTADAANTGNVQISGVTFICKAPGEFHDVWRNQTEAGSWSAGTITTGNFFGTIPSRISLGSVASADTVTVVWYGTALQVMYGGASNRGILTWTTDTLSTNTGGVQYGGTKDTYNAGTVWGGICLCRNLPLGWHSTVISSATKNASSSAFVINIGRWTASSTDINPNVTYVTMNAGDTLPVLGRFSSCVIQQVLSGAPTVQFAPYSNSITLGGTGTALLMFQK